MGSCAIFMIPISFLTGNELLILTLLFSGLSIIIGIVLWIANNRPMIGLPRSALIAMITVSLLVLAAVIAGIAGWWIPGILLLMVIIIMAVVSIGAFQTSPTSTRW
jgi:hypothetical protein